MFSLIYVWINGWVNNRETGDLRRHRGHYDVNVMLVPVGNKNDGVMKQPWRHHNTETLFAWWRHQMETFSASLAICAGNSPASVEFPAQRPVTQSFNFFLICVWINSCEKQSRGWWFETLSRPLWRHFNGITGALLGESLDHQWIPLKSPRNAELKYLLSLPAWKKWNKWSSCLWWKTPIYGGTIGLIWAKTNQYNEFVSRRVPGYFINVKDYYGQLAI